MRLRLIPALLWIVTLTACQPTRAAPPTPTSATAARATATAPRAGQTDAPQPTGTAAPLPATATPSDSPSPTAAPSATTQPTATSTPAALEAGSPLVVDHTALGLFDAIPDDRIAAAAALRFLLRHASIGDNISHGLNCLWGNFGDRRPSACTDAHDLKYDRSRWIFQFRGNPGWIAKVDDFVAETERQLDQFDVFAFMLNYSDGLDGTSYPEVSDPQHFQPQYLAKLEALEAAHPDKTFIWWTMALSRVGMENGQRFNERVREYARANGKILLDIADIQTHAPDGSQHFYDSQLTCRGRPAAEPNGAEVLYAGYTDEDCGGHLNEVGRERLAIAMWVLFAQLAGLDSGTP